MARVTWLGALGFLPWLVLVVSLAVTQHLWEHEQQLTEQGLQASFDARVRGIKNRIEQRLLAYEQVLRGVQGLFAASVSVGRDEFRTYVVAQHLEENYPGVQGVGFSLIVPPARKNLHIAATRKESGHPEYSIRPEGGRKVYTSIIYLEPFVGRNLRAFGYDMYSEPVRRAAMEQARDSGKASLSGKVTLVQETDQDVQAGFLMYLPVYKNSGVHDTVEARRTNIVGWAYAPFRMNDLMHGIEGSRLTELDVEIYDGAESASKALMYDTGNHPEVSSEVRFETAETVEVAGRKWLLRVRSAPPFEARLDHHRAELMAASGTVASLLLALLTWLLVRGRERAERAARQMNRELIRSEERARLAMAASYAALWDYDLTTGRVYLSESWAEFLGGERQPTRTSIEELAALVPEEERAAVRAAILGVVKGIQPSYQVTHRVRKPDGGYIWVLSEGRVTERDPNGRALRMSGSNRDVTERKQIEEMLRKLSTAVEQSPASVVITDAEARIEYVNPRFTEVTGYSAAEALGQNPRILQSGQTSQETYREMWRALKSGEVWRGELINRHKNGAIYWEDSHIAPVKNPEGIVTHYVAVKANITERKVAEKKLLESEASLRAILDNLPYLVWLKDMEGRFVAVNKSFFRTTGRASLKEVLGKTDFDLWPEALAQKYRADDAEVLSLRKQKLTEEMSLDNGEVRWVETFKAPITDAQGEMLGTTGFAQDITERKNAEEQIRHLAHYDTLTALPNRTLFSDRLRHELASAKRDNTRIALMFIDLDKFKPINDELGHHVGDLLLKEAAKRMQECVRESDTVARIGGDEFVVLLPEIETEHDAIRVAEKIRHALNQPFLLLGKSLSISSSIGIAIFPDHGEEETQLVKSADVAMYQAKEAGRNRVKLYQRDK